MEKLSERAHNCPFIYAQSAGRRIRLDLTVGVSRKLADRIFFWYESMVIVTQWNQLRLLIGLVFPKQPLWYILSLMLGNLGSNLHCGSWK